MYAYEYVHVYDIIFIMYMYKNTQNFKPINYKIIWNKSYWNL